MKTLSIKGSIQPFTNSSIVSGEFSTDGSHLLLAHSQGISEITIPEWTGEPILTFEDLVFTDYSVQSDSYSPLEGSSRIISSGSDGFVRVYDYIDSEINEIHSFNIFENPHGQNETSETQENPYENLVSPHPLIFKVHNTVARFATWDKEAYICIADSLQYVFVGSINEEIPVQRISLSMFPKSLEINTASDG